MWSQLEKQTFAMHILVNIPISKDNQTITFGQWIECDMRNILYEKYHTQNLMEKIFPDPFLNN